MTATTNVRGKAMRFGIALVAAVLLSLGCAASHPVTRGRGDAPAGRASLALMPLENLSGSPDAGEALGRLLGVELSARGWCDPVDVGQVQAVLRKQRIRNAAVLSLEQVRAIGDSLGVRYLLTGSVLEHTSTTADDGPVPAVAAALKLLEVTSGRVVWAKSLALTGKDRETVFGYGRETDAAKLDTRLVDTMLLDLKQWAGPGATQGAGEKP